MSRNKYLVILFTISIIICGCRSVKQSTSQTDNSTHSEQNVSVKHDSLLHTIYNDRLIYINGDTIIMEKNHYDTLIMWRDRHDTLIMYDSIDRYKTEYVEKQLTSMQNFWIVLGKILAAAVILIGVAIIIKRKLKG
ncbi:MAG: hypothetical protein LBR17_08385 [Bacteroidales bacterium]|nr:hypothetical protein [Bacteroidales bacterium]